MPNHAIWRPDTRRPTRSMSLRMAFLAIALCLTMFPAGASLAGPGIAPPPPGPVEQTSGTLPRGGPVIVGLRRGTTVPARTVAANSGARPTQVYQSVFRGFSANLSEAAIRNLANNPSVAFVVADLPIYPAAQSTPINLLRSGVHQSPLAAIDNNDNAVNADIAIIDSGVTPHGDLRVVGGHNCTSSDPNAWGDSSGHGTHVAGTAAAIDNGDGVVGVAPGARIWSVKVLGTGTGSTSTLICGLDWVAANAGIIDVANMSLEGTNSAASTCTSGTDPLHTAVCAVTNRGVPIAVAAGNKNTDAGSTVPAKYPSVITTAAMNDYDGRPGAAAGPLCGSGNGPDDFRAYYSNYGSVVDIAAPGTCVTSTTSNGGYGMMSGTSMAAPMVAGALALHKSTSPGSSAEGSRSWLFGSATRGADSAEGYGGLGLPLLYLGGAQVTNPPGTENPALAGSKAQIVSSGDSPSTGISARAYDNDLNSTWYVGGSPSSATLTLDLGATYDVSGVKWKFYSLGYMDQFTVSARNVQGQSRTLGTFGNGGQTQTFYGVGVSDTVYARYVDIRVTNVNNDFYLGSVSEIEVWARNAPQVTNPAGTETPSLAGSKAQIVSSGDDPPTGISSRSYDGDLNSTWYIGGSPSSATLTLDLGGTYDVSGVKWKLYSLGYLDQFTVSARNVQGQSRLLGTFGNGSKTQVFYGVGVSDTVYARYVDIRVTNVNNDFYLGSVSEIEVWARNAPQVTNPAGTENPSLAGTKAPITGSFDSPSTGISGRSYDNDLNSTWYLGGFPTNATLTLDLGATYDVSGVKWKLYSLGYLDQFTVSARNVQGQSRLLGTFGNPSRTQVFYGVGVSDAVYARYVDIRVTNVNGDEYLGSVSEIEIWSRGFIAASDGVSSASASPTATVAATATPTSIPSPTTTPTASPTEAPTVTPTASPTEESTPTEAIATPSVTAEPTTTPTEEIAATPAALPTEESTPTATPSPTATPTEEVAASLATLPTEGPTEDPTVPPTVALDAVTTGVVAGTGGQNVRCRAEPSTDGAVLDEIAEGETVSVIGPEVDGWIPVTCGEGAAGFVSAGFVRLDGEQPLETVTDATATVTATDEVATAESSTGSSPAAGPTEDVPTAVSTGAPTPEPTAVPAETPFPVVRVTDSEQSETGFRAIDQDPETIWSVYPSVSPDEVWLLLDLGEVRPIERVTYELGLRNTLPVFEIWLSEDGETWWNAAIIDGRTVEPNVEYEELLGLDARFAMLVVPDAVASGLGEIGGFREIGVWPGEATQSLSVLGNPTTPEPLPEPPPTEAVIDATEVVSEEPVVEAPPVDEIVTPDVPVAPEPAGTGATEEPTAEPDPAP